LYLKNTHVPNFLMPLILFKRGSDSKLQVLTKI
jgi:hypothetical protein